VEMARTMPTDAVAISRVRGAGSLSGAALKGLAQAISAGIEGEPIEMPREPSRDVVRRVATASELASVLLRIRCDAADLATELVATRAECERFVEGIVTDDIAGQPLAEGWRSELVGSEMRELVEGRISIAALAAEPYLEIIRR